MERITVITLVLVAGFTLAAAFLYWRYVWFFRNPPRHIPSGNNIVSPADGTVVYVKRVKPNDDVIVIKEGMSARIQDIVREDVQTPKVLIGTFMSPFDVHYNRAPLAGTVDFIRHHPARTRNVDMKSMHFRTVFGLRPLYRNSLHILENERTVTRISGTFKDSPISYYVIEIGGGHVHGIDSYFPQGSQVSKGEIFGMIRIGSQVDLVLPELPNLKINVEPGDVVRAGETVVAE